MTNFSYICAYVGVNMLNMDYDYNLCHNHNNNSLSYKHIHPTTTHPNIRHIAFLHMYIHTGTLEGDRASWGEPRLWPYGGSSSDWGRQEEWWSEVGHTWRWWTWSRWEVHTDPYFCGRRRWTGHCLYHLKLCYQVTTCMLLVKYMYVDMPHVECCSSHCNY